MATHSAASTSAEDYAKAIYSLTRETPDEGASTNDLAERLGISTGAVSTMIRRLDDAGLAEHVPYHGVRLTDDGRRLALRVIRRHRILELFLVHSLDMPWQDVHQHAETLEHAASDELIELIAQHLGNPTIDPHGDPIPDRNLEIVEPDLTRVSDLTPGEPAELARVSDADPEMLAYLAGRGIGIGSRLAVIARQPFDGPTDLEVDGAAVSLGTPLTRAMYARRRPAPPYVVDGS
ncbi:MAG: metal-dependent transcriptional regulator [Actinobacteria bacterium]|nr:metal-dependent transcriptional regulator [Thermoleophilia bacterium]MCB9012250.1 metal-dependent transcriptional regulator [Actinomycetota bacterium]